MDASKFYGPWRKYIVISITAITFCWNFKIDEPLHIVVGRREGE